MSGFNTFIRGAASGQAAYQQRHSVFNEAMASEDQQAASPYGANPKSVNRPPTQESGVAFGNGARGRALAVTSRGARQSLNKIFGGLDAAQRQEVKTDLTRKGQIVEVLNSLPVDQQAIGIQTYGKDFGIDDAQLQRAVADPAAALAAVASSLRDAEMMLEQAGVDRRQNDLLDNALSYGNGRRAGGVEPPVTLMAQVANGQDMVADPFARGTLGPEVPAHAIGPDANNPITRTYPHGMQSFGPGQAEADRKTRQTGNASKALKNRPSWNDVSSAYGQVDYGFVAEDVNSIIGGVFERNKFKNTCASRVSFALNSSQNGFLPKLDKNRSVSDKNGHQTIFAVNDLEKTFTRLWGGPDVTLVKPNTARSDTAAQLGTKPGILLIGDAGSKGGDRHATLWTGEGGINEEYERYIPDDQRLLFWQLPTE